MKDNKDFASFLSDDSRNDEVYQDYYGKLKIHKEKYNDRFTVIYSKTHKDSLYQEQYNVAGYYDIKNNCIYNYSYSLQSIIKDNPTIHLDLFSTIHKQIVEDITKYITDYSFNHQNKLKRLALEEFNNYSPSDIDNYRNPIKIKFVKDNNPLIEFNSVFNTYDILNRDEQYKLNVYLNYIINPEDLVKQKAERFIQSNQDKLGMSLLIYDAQEKYLKELQANKNDKYKDIYSIKKIYDAIKGMDAKTLNITIKYKEEFLTFNFSYDRLKRSLEACEKGSCDYGSSYMKVANFIKKNSDNPEKIGLYEDFKFDNIVSITYGRNELYKRDDNIQIKNKTKHRDYER